MMKIAFLDRDGVINREMGSHVWQKERFEVLPDVIPAMRFLKTRGFELIIITNQSGIGLGLYNDGDVIQLHEWLQRSLSSEDIELLDIYFCRHHPENSNCLCRKPKGLMVEKALAKYDAKAGECIMFGDRERDVESARVNGVRGVLLESNSSLLEAAKMVLD